MYAYAESDNKLVKTMIHINGYKLATDRFKFDAPPQQHIDATPPVSSPFE